MSFFAMYRILMIYEVLIIVHESKYASIDAQYKQNYVCRCKKCMIWWIVLHNPVCAVFFALCALIHHKTIKKLENVFFSCCCWLFVRLLRFYFYFAHCCLLWFLLSEVANKRRSEVMRRGWVPAGRKQHGGRWRAQTEWKPFPADRHSTLWTTVIRTDC